MSLGERITELRKSSGLGSQRRACAELGVGLNTLWGYENGKNLPDIDFLARFARATNSSLEELIRLRLEAAGEDPAILSVAEPAPMYEASGLHEAMREDRAGAYGGRSRESLADVAATVRAQVQRANIPIAWSLLLVQLAAVGDLSANGAELIIKLLTSEGVAGQDSN